MEDNFQSNSMVATETVVASSLPLSSGFDYVLQMQDGQMLTLHSQEDVLDQVKALKHLRPTVKCACGAVLSFKNGKVISPITEHFATAKCSEFHGKSPTKISLKKKRKEPPVSIVEESSKMMATTKQEMDSSKAESPLLPSEMTPEDWISKFQSLAKELSDAKDSYQKENDKIQALYLEALESRVKLEIQLARVNLELDAAKLKLKEADVRRRANEDTITYFQQQRQALQASDLLAMQTEQK